MNYKDYWCYKEIIEYGYIVDVKKEKEEVELTIKFDDGDTYTSFLIKEFEVLGDKMLMVYNEDEDITECLDFTQTIDECIKGCLHYFWSRF